MLAVGVNAATDVTGFGLAGHGLEMALGSRVTLTIELSKLPVLRGIEQLDLVKFRTRASKTNREYVGDLLRIEGRPNPTLLEFFFDAQTSGGLLLAVPASRAGEAESVLKRFGTLAASRIGKATTRDPSAAVVLRS